MEFSCWLDYDSAVQKMNVGRAVKSLVKLFTEVVPFEGSLSMEGWPGLWNEVENKGTWTLNVFPVGEPGEKELRVIRRSLLSNLAGWSAAFWKRTFNENSGEFWWETTVPIKVESFHDQDLRFVIWTKPTEACRVEKITETVERTRYVSKCEEAAIEEDVG